MAKYDYDLFICHASGDKSKFVRPLAKELEKWGVKVWFDESTLRVGDSLRESIDAGLSRSRYGVVVFSKTFFCRRWPQAELNALFSREMEGKKVILPVWYKVGSADLRDAGLAIEVDKVALRSRAGVKAIARKLIEVVRPELLELGERRSAAFNAGETFIEEARRKYPGYDFSVQTGATDVTNGSKSQFSFNRGSRRIDIRIADPKLISKPPGGQVTFFGDGVKKALELQRTGKPQTWNPGEFELSDWSLPLAPSDLSSGGRMEAGPNLSAAPRREMRVEITGSPSVVFPLMIASPVRVGSHEAEILISDKETPLEISLVFGTAASAGLRAGGPKTMTLSLSWRIGGVRLPECRKLIEILDGIREGRILRISDVRLEKPLFEQSAQGLLKGDPFPENLRRTIFLASKIGEKFSIPLRMPKVITEEDRETLFHLDCLLNGTEYGRSGKVTFTLAKADGEAGATQEAFICGKLPATLIQEPSNFPGYFPLFGNQVSTPAWVVSTDFEILEGSVDASVFRSSPAGSEFAVTMTPKTPTTLKWKPV